MRLGLGGFFERGVLTALLVFTTLPALGADEDATAKGEAMAKGEAIVSEHCGRCHAIGVPGDSPNKEAPPFRVLSENYPVDDLAESLAEGIMSGHPDMPVFVFQPDEVDAIIAYLQSIQVTPDAAPSTPEPADAQG